MLHKRKFIALLITILLLAVSVSTVFAAPPKALHIEVLEFIGGSAPEPFTATGAAVDDGLVCGYGQVEDLLITSHDTGGQYVMITAHKRFTCDDLSGTFDVTMKVKLDKVTSDTTANWKVVSGTGAYANLKGNGKLVGIANVPTVSIFDIYDGKVH